MPKRSRSSDANPLSSARKDNAGSKTGGGGNSKNKVDQTVDSLWHRKSGAGYHLFISYYGSQPAGVVADAVDFSGNGRSSAASGKQGGKVGRDEGSNGGNSRGMSRAAKRRRQKKKSCPTDNDDDDSKHQPKSNANVDDNSMTCLEMDSSHPLVQAFTSAKNKHPHLAKVVHALSRPLPLTLRFREHKQSTPAELKQLLSTEYSNFIAPVSYDPTKAIYQSTPNSSLCKFNLSKLCPKLKELIVEGSMNGTLARQELGSMLPVLSLRSVDAIKGGSKVLDLCASPGSKTLQALEIVTSKSSSGKSGKVIANDVHTARLDSLREAVRRSGMPQSLADRVTYTNHDASIFPFPKSGKLFDAVICDVPCGGDGTIRKDKHILPMWSPNISNSIHGLQLRILKRALRLVRVGGVVCYSTCSLNPVEDEAVVSAALGEGEEWGEGGSPAYELLDLPESMLPGFVRRPGVNDWKVAFYDQDNLEKDEDDFGSLSFFDSYDGALAAGVDSAQSTFWPKQSSNVRLDRCARLFPQDQGSGGFFLSLIKRMR